jgi:1,4-dihydroxy-2-naphthoate octaprenyltransferase
MKNKKMFLSVLLRASRLEFLALPFLLVTVGYLASMYNGGTSVFRAFLALIGLIFAHLSVNILNEVSDYRTGIDENTEQTPFSGGSKSLVNSDVNPKYVEWVGLLFIGLSILIGIYFMVKVGLVILPPLVLGIIISYTYTDYLTNYSLGELGMSLGLGILPIIGTDLVQNGSVGTISVIVSIPVGMVAFNLLLMNEFPDVEADKKGGRENLIHRFGREGATKIYLSVAFLTYLALALAVIITGINSLVLCVFSVLPLYRPVVWAIKRPEITPNNEIIRDNLLWNLSTTLLIAVSLLIDQGLI